MVTTKKLLLSLVVGLAFGCASSSKQETTSYPEEESLEPAPPPANEENPLRDSYCERLCPKLTACAVADAEASNLSEKELAQAKEAAPKHTEVCLRQCFRLNPPKEKLDTAHACMDQHEECGPLVDCLDPI